MTRCGDMKITMGTGGFVDLNTGSSPIASTTGEPFNKNKIFKSFIFKQAHIHSLDGNWKATR